MLSLSGGVEELGEVRTPLVASLAVAWLLIFACLFKVQGFWGFWV